MPRAAFSVPVKLMELAGHLPYVAMLDVWNLMVVPLMEPIADRSRSSPHLTRSLAKILVRGLRRWFGQSLSGRRDLSVT